MDEVSLYEKADKYKISIFPKRILFINHLQFYSLTIYNIYSYYNNYFSQAFQPQPPLVLIDESKLDKQGSISKNTSINDHMPTNTTVTRHVSFAAIPKNTTDTNSMINVKNTNGKKYNLRRFSKNAILISHNDYS